MSQGYDAIDTSADDVPTDVNALATRTDSLKSNFSGSSAPGSPVEGQAFVDTTTATDPIPYHRINAAWVATGNLKARAAKDMNDFELENARAENLGADPASAAGKAGRLFINTAEAALKVDTGAAIHGIHHGNVTSVVQLPMSSVGCDASNPPTAGTEGTTPTVRGWLFDATNELYSFTVVVPQNWEAATDLTLKLNCVLDGNETNSEDIDWEMDWVALSSGESAIKTSTNVTSATDISNATAAGDMTRCSITFDYDDSDNPISSGDLIIAEIHRTSLASVGGVIVTGAHLEYTGTTAG